MRIVPYQQHKPRNQNPFAGRSGRGRTSYRIDTHGASDDERPVVNPRHDANNHLDENAGQSANTPLAKISSEVSIPLLLKLSLYFAVFSYLETHSHSPTVPIYEIIRILQPAILLHYQIMHPCRHGVLVFFSLKFTSPGYTTLLSFSTNLQSFRNTWKENFQFLYQRPYLRWLPCMGNLFCLLGVLT